MSDQHSGRVERFLNWIGADGERLTGARWMCPECGGYMKKGSEMVDVGYSMARWDCLEPYCDHLQWTAPEVRTR